MSDPLSDSELVEPISEVTLRTKLVEYYNEDISYNDYRNYTVTEAIDIILKYDSIIEKTANELGMEKALIQAVLFREICWVSWEDILADSLVNEYFAYEEQIDYYLSLSWWQQIMVGYLSLNQGKYCQGTMELMRMLKHMEMKFIDIIKYLSKLIKFGRKYEKKGNKFH